MVEKQLVLMKGFKVKLCDLLLIVLLLNSFMFEIVECRRFSCRTNVVKKGYTLKKGLQQDNIRHIGVAPTLQLCNKLFCRHNNFDFALFDGATCFGILCQGSKDRRCKLEKKENVNHIMLRRRGLRRSQHNDTRLGSSTESQTNTHVKRDISESAKNAHTPHKQEERRKAKNVLTNIPNTKDKKHKLSKQDRTSLNTKYTSMDSLTNYDSSNNNNNNTTTVDGHTSSNNSKNNKDTGRVLFHRKHRKRKPRVRNNSPVNKLLLNSTSNSSDTAKTRNSRDYPYDSYSYVLSPKHNMLYTSTFMNNYGKETAKQRRKTVFHPLNNKQPVSQSKMNKRKQVPKHFVSNTRAFTNPMVQNSHYIAYNQSIVANPSVFFRKPNAAPNVQVDSKRSTVYSPYVNAQRPSRKPDVSLTSVKSDVSLTSVSTTVNEQSSSSTASSTAKSNTTSFQTDEIEPLSEFPTEDYNNILETSKDKINPHQDDLMAENEVSMDKDDIDVPFPPSNELNNDASSTKSDRKSVLEHVPQIVPHNVADKHLYYNSTPTPAFVDGSSGKLTQSPSNMPSPRHETYRKLYLQRCVNPLGVSKRTVIKDSQITASSQLEGYPASSGRLRKIDNAEGYTGSWCASPQDINSGKQAYLQIDGKEKGEVCRLATQGDEKLRRWVKRFKLRFSNDGNVWDSYKENGGTKVFFGNTDASDTTYRVLYHPISSRFIRFEPLTWAGETPCMRVELFNTTLNRDMTQSANQRSSIPKEYAGVIMYLTFEKTDDNVVMDRSSYGNNAYMDGGARIIDSHSSCRHAVRVEPGSDVHFDGRIMQMKPRQAITIALWLKLDNKVSGVHSIFDTIGAHSKHLLGQFHFEVVGGDVRWFHRNETADVIFNVITKKKVITPSVWNHITVTYDSQIGSAVIYINGSERVKGKGSGLISGDWNKRIGIGRHKGVRFLDGEIDEFKIYDVPLEKEQVEDLAKKCDFNKYYCGSTLTDMYGSFMSPGYPDAFPGPVECTWYVEGVVGEIISLDMKHFLLGNLKSCGRGNLEVRDAVNDTVIGNYCGSITPRKVRSHSHHMYIKYSTDGVFPGEKFKIDYTREKTYLAKKTLVGRCVPSKTLINATLVGGAKAGNFTDLGIVSDMEECKDRCCNTDKCEVAFMIEDNCYSVTCTNRDLCKVRRSKPTKLYPQLSFINRGLGERPAFEPEIIGEPVDKPLEKSVKMEESKPKATPEICPHNSVLSNVTLAGGIKAGVFTSHGVVDTFDDCLRHCCEVPVCDAAFMVKRTCFSLHCANHELCEPRIARPSTYHPMVSFLKRYSVAEDKEKEVATRPEEATSAKTNEDACKNLRVSKIYKEVTLKGGINSGEFMDKGHITDMLDCIAKCCAVDTCNVAFVIKDTCFAVKCKSYEDCGLKTAVSAYYRPMIAYVNWSPPQHNLGDEIKYNYEGCWRDFDITSFALPLLEGTDTRLSEPYKQREDPVKDCSSVAESKGYNVFAVQNGGACFSGAEAERTFKRYGKSDACKAGKGGPFANSVYKSFDDGSVMSLGCWADLQDRAFKRMENKDPLIMDDHRNRAEPITQCAKVAQKMKIDYFAMQKGGQCFIAKDSKPNYKVFSLSRKCEYGLGGQMANDVYQLAKVDYTVANSTKSDVVGPDEVVYKEEINGDRRLQYVYSTASPIANVTLVSAINAGTFEDKGKVDSIMECVKECGETKDCDVAFSLSSQCFNVHCFSSESCKTKPAYSNFYKPQLAYVKHRIVNSSLNSSNAKRNCSGSSKLYNVTFVEGINAGNFSDMGSVDTMGDCKEKCCQDKSCNIAFKIQGDCYGVQCFSRTSCRTRVAKNAEVFNPEMVLIRPFQSPLDDELRKSITDAIDFVQDTLTELSTDREIIDKPYNILYSGLSTISMSSSLSPPTYTYVFHELSTVPPTGLPKKHSCRSEPIIYNATLHLGMHSGLFTKLGHVKTMDDCIERCCRSSNADVAYMLGTFCFAVKCKTRTMCKPSPVMYSDITSLNLNPAISFLSKEDQTTLLSTADNERAPFTFNPQSHTDELLQEVMSNITRTERLRHRLLFSPHSMTPTRPSRNAASHTKSAIGHVVTVPKVKTTKSAMGHVFTTPKHQTQTTTATAMTSKSTTTPTPQHAPTAKSTSTAQSHATTTTTTSTTTQDLVTTTTTQPHVSATKSSERKNDTAKISDTTAVPTPFFVVETTPIVKRRTSKRSESRKVTSDKGTGDKTVANSNMTGHYSVSLTNLTTNMDIRKGKDSEDNNEGSNVCGDSPITYNVTLRGGVHAGKFTELGEDISMRGCIERCCNTPLCDVSFMFSDKCYAVGCYDEALCQAVIAKPSNLNPKLAYVSKYRANAPLALYNMPSGVDFAYDDSLCSFGNVNHGPIYTNKSLLGGMKSGNFTYLGMASDIKKCLSMCCIRKDCDMAYFVDKAQCFGVACYSTELCSLVDRPFKNRDVEISKLVRRKSRKKLKKDPKDAITSLSVNERSVNIWTTTIGVGTVLAYFMTGLVAIAVGLGGIIYAILIFIKRSGRCRLDNSTNLGRERSFFQDYGGGWRRK